MPTRSTAKAATMTDAYPLQWPAGWPRTPWNEQRYAKFGSKKGESTRVTNITIAEATVRVLTELGRMGVDRQGVVISTNLQLRRDGLPFSRQAAPRDAGAAVYWQTSKGERRVMAIDQYYKVEENLAAIAATLDAMRAIERHGGAQILDRAFTGFAALPAPTAARSWREVMTFGESTPTREQLRQRYRELARVRHPDKGGSDAAMSELNVAMTEAEKEIG